MKRRKKIFVAAGVLVALALVVLAVTRRGTEVETVPVQQGSIMQTVEENGYVQPVNDYFLYAPQNARVVQVAAETGETVKQGQTLVVLENTDLSIQINEVQSRLAQAGATVDAARTALERTRLQLEDARHNLTRVEELFKAGATTQVEYDQARLLVETYEQAINEQSSLLDSALAQTEALGQMLQQLLNKEQQLVIKSPVNGIVLNLPVQKEQLLNPGALVAQVAVPGELEIKADILSDDLAEVKVGQKVTVTAPVLGAKTLTGEVKKIYPQAEEKLSALGISQRRVPVLITLNKPDLLKPGYEVRVAIETLKKQDVLVIPREAVRTTADGQKQVSIVINNRVVHRTVETGLSDKNNIEITAGLTAGDQVIRDGSLALAENSRVIPSTLVQTSN